jgi:hypothetical protein
MARCGTYYGYRCGCRCAQCRGANAEAKRRYRNGKRNLPVDTRLPPGPKPATTKPRPVFSRFGNLEYAITLEDYMEREAADPGCRPITQPPPRRKADTPPPAHTPPTLIDRHLGGTR